MMIESFFPATTMPDRAWWKTLWPEPREVVQRLRIASGMTIVDLCCGDGFFTAPLAKLTNGKVYAIDIDREMPDQARAEAARQEASVTEWICADARDIAELVPHHIDDAKPKAQRRTRVGIGDA